MHETQQGGITLAHLLEELEPDLAHLSDANHQMLWDVVTLWKDKQWLLMRVSLYCAKHSTDSRMRQRKICQHHPHRMVISLKSLTK